MSFGVVHAQWTASYPSIQESVDGLDALFLFNGISLTTEITYTGGGSDFEWSTFDGDFQSNQATLSPEDGVGYVLKVDGVETARIWVIDYAKYPVAISAIDIVEADDRCDYIKVVPTFSAPDLTYKDRNGVVHLLPRTFTFAYDVVTFGGDAWSQPTPKYFKKATPFAEVVFDAPLCDTQFTMAGDDWAERFGMEVQRASSEVYHAIAVEAHLKGTVEERAAKNELDRSGADVSGSGPLVVAFESRVNQLSTNYYEWFIFSVNDPANYIRYNDRDLRYTFAESGSYRVRLVATSEVCEFVDSLDVKVLDSSLEVPNVFTPNGDGVNDEFRVAFKSLATYSCQIFNRWGRLVYKSNDPGKGWDGTINGKPAAPGAYYYVIQATGTDVDDDGKPVKYKLSGDINLLRGKK
ncbi:MAG: gliding motility-associated C-terminal domain-containing protein [Paludibacteraceae bacterium]